MSKIQKFSKIDLRWEMLGRKLLEGETVREVRLATDEECKNLGAEYNRPYLIIFVSGKVLITTSDDEGNDVGVFVVFVKAKNGKFKEEILPRLRLD